MSVIRVAIIGLSADDPVVLRFTDNASLTAKLVFLMALALGNTTDFRSIQAVQLVLVVLLLVKILFRDRHQYIDAQGNQNWLFTVLTDVPTKDLIRRCCLIHLKNSSTDHRCLYIAVTESQAKNILSC